MKVTVQSLMLSAAALALTACGGGGGGGGGSGPGGGVTTPPPPSATLLLAPIAVVAGAGGGSVTGATEGNSLAITDPDAPSATTFGALKLDGDETIRIRTSVGGVTVDKTLTSATYKDLKVFEGAYKAYAGPNASQARVLAGHEWRAGGDVFTIIDLEEGDHPLGGSGTTGNVTEAVKLARWESGQFGAATTGFVVMGDPAAMAPTSGAARFRGEAIGRFENGGVYDKVVARAGLDIDFTTGAVRGGVEDFNFNNFLSRPSGRYDFSYEATLSGGKFDTTKIDAPFFTGETGSVHGQLYGPGGDLEVGGTFDLTTSGGRIVGGFVAGRPSDSGEFVAENVNLRPSFASLLSQAGYTNAYYNQNDIERAGGGNVETVIYNAGGFVAGDERYDIHTNDGAYTLSAEFDAGDYIGRSIVVDYRPTTFDPSFRSIDADVWKNGGATLNRFSTLGVRTDGVWFAPALVQAMEYVAPNLSPGLEQRVYFTVGPRIRTVPTEGTARYMGESIGAMTDLGFGQTYRTVSTATVDVIFQNGDVRGSLGDFRVYNMDGTAFTGSIAIDEINFSASLDARGSFDTTLADAWLYAGGSNRQATGHVRGDLYGKSASELGGIYDLNIAGVASLAGVFIGARNALPQAIGSSGTVNYMSTSTLGRFATSVQPLNDISLIWGRGGPGANDDTVRLAFSSPDRAVRDEFPVPYQGGGHNFRSGGEPIDRRYMNLAGVGLDPGANNFDFITLVEQAAGVDLRYGSVASWRDWSDRKHYFVAFGERTEQVPTTGAANYKGATIVNYTDAGATYTREGALSMAVDFAKGAVSGSSAIVQPPSGPDMNFTFEATVAGPQFTGAFANTGKTITGPLAGTFAGPAAQEAVGTFASSTAPAGVSMSGGFAAVKQ